MIKLGIMHVRKVPSQANQGLHFKHKHYAQFSHNATHSSTALDFLMFIFAIKVNQVHEKRFLTNIFNPYWYS